jgi:hypothetical protein
MACIYLLAFALPALAQKDCSCAIADQLKPAIYEHADNGRIAEAALLYKQIQAVQSSGCQLVFLHGMSQLFMQQKQWDSSRLLLDKAALILAKMNCDPAIQAKHYSIKGLFYTRLSKIDSAAISFIQATIAAEKGTNLYALARAYGDVAASFFKIGDIQKSVFYDKKAVATAEKLQDTPGIQLLSAKLNNLAGGYSRIFHETGNAKYLDSAYQISKQALTTAKLGGEIKSVHEALHHIAQYYFIKRDFTQSNTYSDSIIRTHIRGFTDRSMFLAYTNKAELALLQGLTKNASAYADSSLLYAASFNAQSAITALDLVYRVNKRMNYADKALQAFERKRILEDSIMGLEKQKAIEALEAQYNQTKNEYLIESLSKQRLLYGLLAFTGTITALMLFFLYRQQKMRLKQRIMEAEQRLSRARMNPHFFFNALTTLQRIALKENDGKVLANNLSRFSHIMRETLESTYKEYVTIKQEAVFLKEYLEIQQIRYPEKFTYSIMIDGDIEPEEILIPSMIVQPFVENSIEHGFSNIQYPAKLEVHFYLKQTQIVITIQDNGKGLYSGTQEKEPHISRASQIIRDRIYLLNIRLKTKASFSIDNQVNQLGVLVQIQLPIIYRHENPDY